MYLPAFPHSSREGLLYGLTLLTLTAVIGVVKALDLLLRQYMTDVTSLELHCLCTNQVTSLSHPH